MPVVPVLPPIATGILTSSTLSAIEAASLFLQKPPTAELVQIVAQSIPNATFTALTFTSHLVDQDYLGGLMHSDSVNTSRATANYPGEYLVSGTYSTAANATGVRGVQWAVNGTAVNNSGSNETSVTANIANVVAVTMRVYLNIGDYVELQAFQSSGGALLTNVGSGNASRLSIGWVSN